MSHPPAVPSVRVALASILADPTMSAFLRRFDPELLEWGERALGRPQAGLPRRHRPIVRCGGCRTADVPLGLYDRIARAQGANRGRLYTHVWLCPDCAHKTQDASPERLLARNPSIARHPPEGVTR